MQHTHSLQRTAKRLCLLDHGLFGMQGTPARFGSIHLTLQPVLGVLSEWAALKLLDQKPADGDVQVGGEQLVGHLHDVIRPQ